MGKVRLLIGLCVLFFAQNVLAYIGPGLGVSTVVAVLGILFGIFLLFLGVIWYPLKRLFLKLKKNENDESADDEKSL